MKRWMGILISTLLICTLAACGSGPTSGGETTAATTAHTTAALPREGWITADSLRVRSGPGLSHEIIGGLKTGDRVEILGKTGDWYEIRFSEDTVGYVSGQYLTFTAPTN